MMNVFEYSKKLKELQLLPENIEVSQWGSWSLVSAYTSVSSKFISESVCMGVDKNINIALAKALTEFCERKISKDSNDKDTKLTVRSDGFAAFPVFGFSKSEAGICSAKNALNEAIERYVWSKWWDDKNTQYEINEETAFEDFEKLQNDFLVKKLFSIRIPTDASQFVLILLAENEVGGYLTGGAAGTAGEEYEIFNRAFGELLRYLIVFNKIKKYPLEQKTFYEKRLYGFASGLWGDLVRDRLKSNSDLKIKLPKLIVDKVITHNHMDTVSVHRCLFENQPEFMGGFIERLCI